MKTPVQYKRVAVVGSRDFKRLDLVEAAVQNLGPSVIVSGGARGVDTAAEKEAKRLGYPEPAIHRADWRLHGKKAGMLRNLKIINDCEALIVFWDGSSPGTAHTLKLAERAERPVLLVVSPNGTAVEFTELRWSSNAPTDPAAEV